jgi:hypothetical protein
MLLVCREHDPDPRRSMPIPPHPVRLVAPDNLRDHSAIVQL